MKRCYGMTHEEHVALAERIRAIDEELNGIRYLLIERYGRTSRPAQQLWLMLKRMIHVKGSLDTEYHRVTSNLEFAKRGHVYYEELSRE